MQRQLTKDLNNLNDNDLINLLLYGLYKLSNNPEYSSLCELVYVLDKENLFKLCSVYGGSTITVPTITELKKMVNVLLVYQKIHEGKSFEKAYTEVDTTIDSKKELFDRYQVFSKLLEDYD